ncbi:unnamed protein product [Ascophyllum nodosum]
MVQGSHNPPDRTPFTARPGSWGLLSRRRGCGLTPLVAGAGGALADNEIVEKFVAEKNAEATVAGWVEPEVTPASFHGHFDRREACWGSSLRFTATWCPRLCKNFEALLTGENDAGVSYKTEAYKGPGRIEHTDGRNRDRQESREFLPPGKISRKRILISST